MFINSYLRKNQFFQNLNIMSLLILLFLSFSILPTKSFSQEDTISSIIVDGNKRIKSETIISAGVYVDSGAEFNLIDGSIVEHSKSNAGIVAQAGA